MSGEMVDCEIERYATDETGEERSVGALQLAESTVIKIGAVGGVISIDGTLLDMLDRGLISADDAALIALGERPMPGFA